MTTESPNNKSTAALSGDEPPTHDSAGQSSTSGATSSPTSGTADNEHGLTVEYLPPVGQVAFAKISEVEGVRLSEEAETAFAKFDSQGLSDQERRRAIIERFKRVAS
jgi:hypothetical protein